jgi:hypothetical protein
MPILVIAAAICALIGLYIGNSKGRPVAGAMWGLLVGPIGWLVMAIVKDERRKCPDCLGTVPIGARRCQHCGSELNKAASVICSHCGAKEFVVDLKPLDLIKCNTCGRKFRVDSSGTLAALAKL